MTLAISKDRNLYTSLALAGVLPFVACAVLPLFDMASIEPFGQLDQLANSYGLAIVCFLAGIHWATFLMRENQLPLNLMISSNVVFLGVWFMFVLTETAWSLLAQVVALVVLLLIDQRLKNDAIISESYFQTRVIATTIASAALVVIALT